MSGNFFKAVVQQVLLFGAEIWVVSSMMERVLSAFYTWGGETANRQKTAEREGWEVVLPLTGGSHEGGGTH